MHLEVRIKQIKKYLDSVIDRYFPNRDSRYLPSAWLMYDENKDEWKICGDAFYKGTIPEAFCTIIANELNQHLGKRARILALDPLKMRESVATGYFFGSLERKEDLIKEVVDYIILKNGLPERENLVEISALEYERRSTESYVWFCDGSVLLASGIGLQIEFQSGIKRTIPENLRITKKCMEFSGAKNVLLAERDSENGYELKGLLKYEAVKGILVHFNGVLNWEILEKRSKRKSKVLAQYSRGVYHLPGVGDDDIGQDVMSKAVLCCRRFGIDEVVEKDIENLYKSACAGHGGAFIFIFDQRILDYEVERLTGLYRGIKIKTSPVSDMLKNEIAISGIDGALIIDREMNCHAVGVIVDGMACEGADPGRGARYNSMIQYSEYLKEVKHSTKHMILVVSEDRMPDVICGENEGANAEDA